MNTHKTESWSCLTRFKEAMVLHPILERVYDKLLTTINEPADRNLIFVVGPTGVGKTTLRDRAEKAILEQAQESAAYDPGRIPVAGMEVAALGTSNFSWKSFYIHALRELDEPMIDYKVDLPVRGLSRNARGQLTVQRNMTSHALRLAFDHCLKHRNLRAFFLDEAHHIGIGSPKSLSNHMRVIKSIANASDTVLVLMGTYDLLHLTNLSAQLARRSRTINLRRYRWDVESEKNDFRSVILSLQSKMTLDSEPDLVAEYEYLYRGSLGCVGILKTWLVAALADALENGDDTISHDNLERTIMHQRERLRIMDEIRVGEQILAEQDYIEKDINQFLGLSMTDNPGKKKSGSRAPGTRNPVRDPVGG